MIWTRGPASDLDRLAHVTGDSGWSWDSLRRTSVEVFSPLSGTSLPQSDRGPQVEDLVPPSDGHDTTGEINPAIHGLNGPVKISVQDTTALDSRIFNTTTQLAEFPFNEDMSS